MTEWQPDEPLEDGRTSIEEKADEEWHQKPAEMISGEKLDLQASTRVLSDTYLVEMILAHLPAEQIALSSRVSKAWDLATHPGSMQERIQQGLWLEPFVAPAYKARMSKTKLHDLKLCRCLEEGCSEAEFRACRRTLYVPSSPIILNPLVFARDASTRRSMASHRLLISYESDGDIPIAQSNASLDPHMLICQPPATKAVVTARYAFSRASGGVHPLDVTLGEVEINEEGGVRVTHLIEVMQTIKDNNDFPDPTLQQNFVIPFTAGNLRLEVSLRAWGPFDMHIGPRGGLTPLLSFVPGAIDGPWYKLLHAAGPWRK